MTWGNTRQLRKRREHARGLGRSAYLEGTALSANPYRDLPGERMERQAWASGWRDAAPPSTEPRANDIAGGTVQPSIPPLKKGGPTCGTGSGLCSAILTILFLGIAAASDSGPRWKGPSLDTLGVRIEACSYIEGPAELPAQFWPESYRGVDRRPDLVWLSYAVLNAEPVRWPGGMVPVLYGPTWRAAPAQWFVVGGPPDLNPLPPAALAEPDRLWRRRFPCCNAVASMLFVGYPRGRWDPDSAARVRLERPR